MWDAIIKVEGLSSHTTLRYSKDSHVKPIKAQLRCLGGGPSNICRHADINSRAIRLYWCAAALDKAGKHLRALLGGCLVARSYKITPTRLEPEERER